MWWRVSSGQVPIRIVSCRRRTSTVSSATSRWPRTIRSSAHSLLPMPLSPAISTPRPRMSISTACIIVRSASESSSIDDSLAIAVGVATAVFSSGSRARSASTSSSGRRREAAGDEHAGKIERQRQAQRVDARRRLEALEIADLALAEDQDASRLQVFVEAGEREAGLLDVGAGDDAVEAVGARPAARAAGRTPRAGCRAAPATVTPGGRDIRR